MIKITYLGQAGILFESYNKKIMIDPYLSDSVCKTQPKFKRKVPVDEKFFSIKPDVMIITHNHGDHYDKETFNKFVTEESHITVLCPYSVWRDARKIGGNNNFILFDVETSVTLDCVIFTAVKAVHSDKDAIGVIIDINSKKYYITGDTLYSEKVFSSLPKTCFEAVFLPINGVGNNMNSFDAKRFIERLNVKFSVPIHVGLFDDISGEMLNIKNRIVPEIFKEINFNED